MVGGMLLSVAVTAFLTGVTEPLEFLFMFPAPLLYLMHAVLTGISLFVATLLGIHAGFSFCRCDRLRVDVQPAAASKTSGCWL